METPPASPRMTYAAVFGLAAALAVGLIYGILADPVGLSWGLIIVGIVGGLVIGSAVARGAWSGRFHLIVPSVRWLAVMFAVLAWIVGAIFAYVGSQLFYQAATTPVVDRLSIAGLTDYLGASVFTPSILGLAAMAFMAWRSAR